MSEYIARCAGSHPAKLHWSYQKEASGKTTLMLKHTGSASEVYSLASSFVVGGSYTFTANCQCPVSGTFYGERMIAQQTDVGIYEVQRYYSRGGDGGSSGTCGFDCTDYDELSYQAQTLGVAERIAETVPCVNVLALEAYIGAMPLGETCAEKIADCFGGLGVSGETKKKVLAAIRAGSYWVYMPVLSRVQKQTSRFSGVGGTIGKISKPDMNNSSIVPSNFCWLMAGDSISYDGVYWVRRREWIGATSWSDILYCGGST